MGLDNVPVDLHLVSAELLASVSIHNLPFEGGAIYLIQNPEIYLKLDYDAKNDQQLTLLSLRVLTKNLFDD